jgi:SAM-dependent methyltransferase
MPGVDLLRESRIAHRMRVPPATGPDLSRDCHELPLATQSIDLVVLPHVLEFAAEPHAILREVDRVMMPEGRLVIVGFNPWSLWGLRSALGFSRDEYPWNGRFLSLLRVKDWLALLGFDVTPGRLIGYAPPFDRAVGAGRFGFMEPAGDRWWAVGGAVYMLQAIKRVRGMRLITPAWMAEGRREKALARRQAPERQARPTEDRQVKDRINIYTGRRVQGQSGSGRLGRVLGYDGTERELFGGERPTTNNRMELTAVIEALAR